jgi:hypothetical protein
MRLYPKKLRNIDDLEKEKALLMRKSRELEKEDILSIEGLIGKKGKEKGQGSILDLLPVSNPVVSALVKIIQRRLSQKDKQPKAVNAPPPSSEVKPRSSKLKAIAIEFIGGYLKWKAIELSFKGIRHLIRSRRERKENKN